MRAAVVVLALVGCGARVAPAVEDPSEEGDVAIGGPPFVAPILPHRLHRDSDGGTCALAADGTTRCWGGAHGATAMFSGEAADSIGISGTGPLCTWSASGMVACDAQHFRRRYEHVIDVAATAEFACVLALDGTVECVPMDGRDGDAAPWQGIIPINQVVQLAASDTRVCGRRVTGAVACWDPETEDPTVKPNLNVSDVIDLVSAVELDGRHMYALRASGNLVEIGSDEAVGTPELPDATRRIVPSSLWSCALGRGVSCWLRNTAAVPIEGTTGAIELVTGRSSCAAFSTGSVVCWDEHFVATPVELSLPLNQ